MSRVVVAGSINMDVVAFAEHHPKPGETVSGSNLRFFPGGKGANQAVAAAKLGADTVLLGRVGNDEFGVKLVSFLNDQGVLLEHVASINGVPTGAALIVVDAASQNTIVVVPGANACLSAVDVLGYQMQKSDVLVSQFEIPQETIHSFFRKGKQSGAITVLNPAPAREFSEELMDLTDVLVLNETELAFLSGLSDLTSESDLLVATNAIRRHSAQAVVVTLGSKGALLDMPNHQSVRVPGLKVDAIDTTGAGDCFTGALAKGLCEGSTLTEAAFFANTAAAICVQRLGAGPSMPTLAEVSRGFSTVDR